MKASEQNDVCNLGRLRSLCNQFDDISLNDKELNSEILDIKRALWEVLDKHWDKCNKLVTVDDT